MAIGSDYPVTQPFGYDPNYPLNAGSHRGIDYAFPQGTPVTVNGVDIALSGNTGYSTGAHLHVGKWVNGSPVNPGVNNGFSFQSATVLETGNDAINGNYIKLQADGAVWVYLHLSQINVTKGQTIKGDNNMPELTNLSTARILGDGVLGRDGIDGRTNSHNGDSDEDYKKYHVGVPLTNQYIYDLFTSGEASAFRDARIRNIQNRDNLIKQLQIALKNEQNKPPKEVIKEIEKIVEKPVEVVKIETVYTHDQETKNMITSIFNYFVGQFKTFQKYIKK